MNYISGYCRIHQGKVFPRTDLQGVESVPFPGFLETIYEQLGMAYPKFYKMDPQSSLGVVASELLLRELPMEHYRPDEVAVTLSNAAASLDTDLRYQHTLKQAPSPAAFVYTLSNIAMGEICIRHGFQGENAFFITPAFDVSWMASYVETIMTQEQVQACLGGWLNVLGDQYDVFLYLVEKQKRGLSMVHSADTLATLYR